MNVVLEVNEMEVYVVKDLSRCMEGLGFTPLEIKIYLALLDHNAMSPYQIAKKIDISRPSIYNALEHMMAKGMVELIPSDTVMYVAQQPEVLLGKIEKDYESNLALAKEGLKDYQETRYEEKYANIDGFDIMIEKARYILSIAKEEVFINTDIDISILSKEIKAAILRGARVVIFSFVKMPFIDEAVEMYSHNRERHEENVNTRFMIVADEELVMIADANKARGNWKGTVTNNKLMRNIIIEHIHNDIYMLRLRDVYGYDFYEKVQINTNQEKKGF